MPNSFRRELLQELVDFHLGLHVHPAGRLVADENARPRQQRPRHHHLLLIAAAQLLRGHVEGACDQSQLLQDRPAR